jgi:putative NADPH-quinone reductase
MKRILVVAAHDHMVDSVMNKRIVEGIRAKMPDAVIDDLDAIYGDNVVDVKAEQDKLVAADIIVLQFPLYWYSMPGLMHRWMEYVFVHGFSHGSKGKALQGKTLVASFTTGAPAVAYTKTGPTKHTLEELMIPLECTCALTSMHYGGYVATTGVSYALRTEAHMPELEKKADEHVDRLIDYLKKL